MLIFSGERGAPGDRRLYVTDPTDARSPDRLLTTDPGFNGHASWNTTRG